MRWAEVVALAFGLGLKDTDEERRPRGGEEEEAAEVSSESNKLLSWSSSCI